MRGNRGESMTFVLGLSAYYHDSAACLLRDGEIIAAAQEERFSRKKHDPRFPTSAVRYCLKEARVGPHDLDHVAFYDKPFIKFERILETYLRYAPKGLKSFILSMPLWLKEKLFLPSLLPKELDQTFGLKKGEIRWEEKILYPEHHHSHAASAFFASPYERAAVLTIDGVGEWATTSAGVGCGNDLSLLYEQQFPHSLGLLYAAFTYYTGFKINSGEYKVMGLAPYGRPLYVDQIYRDLIDMKEDGSFTLNMDFFNYASGLTMTNGRFDRLFGGPRRLPESPVTQREMDIARSIQEVTEEVVLRIARFLKRETGEEDLCMAGGVALNCVANGKLLREGIFKRIWIQPAAGDAGGAVGAALTVWHQFLEKPRKDSGTDRMRGSYLGPSFDDAEIEEFLTSRGIPYRRLPEEEMIDHVAEWLGQGKVVGWFQGRMEFGPRALGNRSILGDARNPEMQSVMNLKIKYRESFRPFAPSVLSDRVTDWFDLTVESPYMLLVASVKESRLVKRTINQNLWGIDLLKVPRSEIPAVTHVDFSARIQTVDRETNRRYHALLTRFEEKTGCPVIVNTSFNVRGEPIVCNPAEAYTCFMRTEMDALALGNCLLEKQGQPAFVEDQDWRKSFELD